MADWIQPKTQGSQWLRPCVDWVAGRNVGHRRRLAYCIGCCFLGARSDACRGSSGAGYARCGAATDVAPATAAALGHARLGALSHLDAFLMACLMLHVAGGGFSVCRCVSYSLYVLAHRLMGMCVGGSSNPVPCSYTHAHGFRGRGDGTHSRRLRGATWAAALTFIISTGGWRLRRRAYIRAATRR